MNVRKRHLFLFLSLLVIVSACVGQPRPTQQADDERAEAHAKLAEGYMQRRQYDVALEELELALSIEADNPRANYVMAVLQVRFGNHDKAGRYFRRAVGAKENYARAQHDYGVFLCSRRRFKEALKWFEKALGNPLYLTPGITHLHVGKCLLDQDNPDLHRAGNHLRAALADSPRMPAALYNMARLRYAMGKNLSARGYMERYLEVGRDTPKTLLLAVKIERALGDKEVEAEYVSRLRAKFPKSREARELATFAGQ